MIVSLQNGQNEKYKTVEEFLGEAFLGLKGQLAINKLFQEKRGHVPDAFDRVDIGSITLVWGDEFGGLCHIIKRRTDEGIDVSKFLSNLSEVIEKGVAREDKNQIGRLNIWYSGKMVILETDYRRNKFNWVLTGFYQSREPK